MSNKIKKSNPPPANQAISEAKKSAEKRATELINFSFRYLDSENEKFSYTIHEAAYFCEILERIKNLSSLTKQEILSNRNAALKTHPIDWEDTSEKNGFPFPKQEEIVDTPYQFAISRNEYGRVHGFFIYNTFYIVWLDKEHHLYPKS
jgi:hypothetical protein